MSGKAGLVEQIKGMQRSDPYGRQTWWDYCEMHLGGVKDPNRHDEGTLATFLSLYNSGGIPPSEPRPDTHGNPYGACGGWGGGKGYDMMGGGGSWDPMMGGQAGGPGNFGCGGGASLGDFVKTGQRQSKHWTNAWQTYCALYGGGINDPSKHEDSFTKSFIEYVGEIAANGLSALASSQGINLEEVVGQSGGTKRPATGGAASPAGMPAKQGRFDMDTSAQKQALVDKVKHLQRTNMSSKESWWVYCDQQCGGMRDPMRHDVNSLEAWLASQGVVEDPALYAARMQQPLTIKYIDPTYTIRAVPANTNDSVYCSVLGAHAVHVAMAGYTGIVVGKVDERYVMLPNHAITKAPARREFNQ
ncbi:unnamed protein product [Cladocopium goreaui]|uniref:Uncharacterized protein n=1 Tax=Cladocopium goreaui TaxID=2562237 RepID=A0A9P1BUR6_9DINO|nr:unnamed protein product [Cladocopium goreaui]